MAYYVALQVRKFAVTLSYL
ncbi:hypothetical protein CCACVL1_09274 [Corchorus capsularis]|uniref:Uncharacterized protein n=1 Tax=Corchorus capsularis TaxID=210143 RepID=A0A1R3IWX0_COCAP|nr:hypothetical protein CCACVL1_09274 [Corchorus capsularis]